MPNVLGDSENYVMANPMQTPPAIDKILLGLLFLIFSQYFFVNIIAKSKTNNRIILNKDDIDKNNLPSYKGVNNTKKGFITINNRKQ